MASIEVTITGMLYDKQRRTTQNVVLIGEASYSGLGVGGGPMPGGGAPVDPGYGYPIEHPEHPIARPPGGERPSHPIYYPGASPEHPIVIPPPPTEPPTDGGVKPPPPGGGWGYHPEYGWGYFPQPGEASPKQRI